MKTLPPYQRLSSVGRVVWEEEVAQPSCQGYWQHFGAVFERHGEEAECWYQASLAAAESFGASVAA